MPNFFYKSKAYVMNYIQFIIKCNLFTNVFLLIFFFNAFIILFQVNHLWETKLHISYNNKQNFFLKVILLYKLLKSYLINIFCEICDDFFESFTEPLLNFKTNLKSKKKDETYR